MHRSSPPARKLAALAAGLALAVSACGGSGGSAPQAAAGPVELTVSLFGTFGYQETGLFAEYEKQNPGVTIKYDSTQSEDAYWPALQTRLASGKGSSDVQGIEVARIADVVSNQQDLWTDLRDTAAGSAVTGYLPWKEKAATTKEGAVLGLGTDIGPMALCYRSDLLGKAGLPTDPATLAAQTLDLARLPRPRREVQGGRARGLGLDRLGGRALQRDRLRRAEDLLRRVRRARLRRQPGRQAGLRHRGGRRVDRAHRQARAVRRPRLGRGLRLGHVRDDRLPVLDDRLHQGQGG